MGTGAALGAAGGAAAAGMAGRHHDHNRGMDERGMGNERGTGVERGMEQERGMGNTGMVSTPRRQLRLWLFGRNTGLCCLVFVTMIVGGHYNLTLCCRVSKGSVHCHTVQFVRL